MFSTGCFVNQNSFMEYFVFYGKLILALVKAAFGTNQNIHGALLHTTENCKICAFSILSESASQKASISHKQENTRAPKYRQNLRWAVILPPARAPPFLTFAYPCK